MLPRYVLCCKFRKLHEVKATPVLSIAPDTESNTVEFYRSHRPTLSQGGRVTQEREFQMAGTIGGHRGSCLPAEGTVWRCSQVPLKQLCHYSNTIVFRAEIRVNIQ